MKEIVARIDTPKGPIEWAGEPLGVAVALKRFLAEDVPSSSEEVAAQPIVKSEAPPEGFPPLRIFMASPEDVRGDRIRLIRMLEHFRKELGLSLELRRWDPHTVPDVGQSQGGVFGQLPPKAWNTFVGILWLRFDSKTGGTAPDTGQLDYSGTEEEFKAAYRLCQESTTGWSKVMFLRCIRSPENLLYFDDPENAAQYARVQQFFKGFASTGLYHGLVQEYTQPEEFERLVRGHLEKWLQEYSSSMEYKRRDLSIQELAQLMQARRELGEPPYVLLLGSSLSLTPAVRRGFAGTEDLGAFWKEMKLRSRTERRARLRKLLDELGLEPGYQAMARLAEAGYFDVILTLNVDDTLDNALKILSASECRIRVHGEVTSKEIVTALGYPTPRIKVVKLRGDINARKLPLTPEAQFEFPPDLKQAVTRCLSCDTIVVGDLPFDDDVQRCLSSGPDALWCILPDKPASDSFIMRAKQSRSFGEIIPYTEFNVFFTALAERLKIADN